MDMRKARVWNLLDNDPDIRLVAKMSITPFVASVPFTLTIQNFPNNPIHHVDSRGNVCAAPPKVA